MTLRASRLLLARAFHRGATCLRRRAVQSHQPGATPGRGAGRACPSDCRAACGGNVEAARPLEHGAPLPRGVLLEAWSAGWRPRHGLKEPPALIRQVGSNPSRAHPVGSPVEPGTEMVLETPWCPHTSDWTEHTRHSGLVGARVWLRRASQWTESSRPPADGHPRAGWQLGLSESEGRLCAESPLPGFLEPRPQPPRPTSGDPPQLWSWVRADAHAHVCMLRGPRRRTRRADCGPWLRVRR